MFLSFYCCIFWLYVFFFLNSFIWCNIEFYKVIYRLYYLFSLCRKRVEGGEIYYNNCKVFCINY